MYEDYYENKRRKDSNLLKYLFVSFPFLSWETFAFNFPSKDQLFLISTLHCLNIPHTYTHAHALLISNDFNSLTC